MYYRTYGNDPDREWVVFIHGAGGSSSIWFKQIREFRKHFNLLMIDLRGHGRSAGLTDPKERLRYTFDDIARDIIEVLDHLQIGQVHLVGMSLGSILARIVAEQAPGRVKSMILGGAITRLDFRSRFLVGMGNLFKRVVPYIWLYKLFAWIIMPRRGHREARSLFVREAKKLCQREFLRWFRLTWKINPLLRLFEEKELHLPVLYLMGEEDHMFLPEVRRLVAKHRNSFLKIIRGAGHVCNVDRPAAFNRFAVQFIYRWSEPQPAVAAGPF